GCFFFSSRRRHTRSKRDWSSDVCSSDLGLEMLASMRLCANVPAQYAIQTALGGYQSIDDLIKPDGRLGRQRELVYEMLNDIPGVSCVKPKSALYAFPRLDPKMYPIHDDEAFVLNL